ncbi:XrtA/PEP-CTERM system histidine kinase PrsK [Hephaestia sp. GCM10023244]|uniref:XrtA/PEP-CTERM system histidine kinase PrsK n=1 Tax=unclassified Hephaestia TaxID=2631281 RepID=UPI0020773524|nr:XrtA/PEP-CTERM system histidine kinase PrsK [Hephaestia sp. MAHUQ-44]MCM8730809.1 PEP-CTERM system histidine kinase PrsK [Hephaestia sp. MAHUQ-44]
MVQPLILWGHALAALLFGVLAVSQVRGAGSALPRLTFLIALGMTALWALAVAGIDDREVAPRLTESLRNLAWLAFMYALVRRGRRATESAAITGIYTIVGLIVLIGLALGLTAEGSAPAFAGVRMVLAMMVAVSALVLVHHLHVAVSPRARDGIRLAVMALAALWLIDLLLTAAAYAGIEDKSPMIAIRGFAVAALAPLFALAVHRNGDWSLRLSRTVTYQSLSLIGIAVYVLSMVLATSAITAWGGGHARIAQTAFVFGSTAAALTLLSSPWLRAWIRVKLAKHLFRHRYDYRAEWVRFTDTLGQPGADAAPLDERIVKAIADLTESPGGVLLVPEEAELGFGAAWNWPADALPSQTGDAALAAFLGASSRIVELDRLRTGHGDPAELASVPIWMLDCTQAWVLVPLVHFGQLTGVILLARPPLDRALDWEDFDLLHIAGRQVASYLAEARAQGALADAQRFDEFNRRFAFILHDIKNLVSQLSLVARNAERHADNPDFRADMIATLKESAGRMNDLLARLSLHHAGGTRTEPPTTIHILPLIERVAAGRRAQHPIVTSGTDDAIIEGDPARLEQVLGHLVQNAIEASPPTEPVTLAISTDGERVAIDVIDRGCGMAPGFVRDQLFRPFVSSKPGGFGIGAFEARQLTAAMGGEVSVTSREGEGTRFRVTLPAARRRAALDAVA